MYPPFKPAAKMHPWWVWVYWLNPITHAQLGLSISEMTAARWQSVRKCLIRRVLAAVWLAVKLALPPLNARVYPGQ